MAKATSLIKAYKTELIPSEGGFIVSAFFQSDSNYAIYEITAYRNVKDIFQTADGMVFKTDGNRAFILIEPPTFPKKHIDPVNREEGKSIPFRLSEVEIYQTKRVEKVMVPGKHVDPHSSVSYIVFRNHRGAGRGLEQKPGCGEVWPY